MKKTLIEQPFNHNNPQTEELKAIRHETSELKENIPFEDYFHPQQWFCVKTEELKSEFPKSQEWEHLSNKSSKVKEKIPEDQTPIDYLFNVDTAFLHSAVDLKNIDAKVEENEQNSSNLKEIIENIQPPKPVENPEEQRRRIRPEGIKSCKRPSYRELIEGKSAIKEPKEVKRIFENNNSDSSKKFSKKRDRKEYSKRKDSEALESKHKHSHKSSKESPLREKHTSRKYPRKEHPRKEYPKNKYPRKDHHRRKHSKKHKDKKMDYYKLMTEGKISKEERKLKEYREPERKPKQELDSNANNRSFIRARIPKWKEEIWKYG